MGRAQRARRRARAMQVTVQFRDAEQFGLMYALFPVGAGRAAQEHHRTLETVRTESDVLDALDAISAPDADERHTTGTGEPMRVPLTSPCEIVLSGAQRDLVVDYLARAIVVALPQKARAGVRLLDQIKNAPTVE